KRRFEPPSTLMHWTRLAPLLSATSRLDCIWIIDPVPSQLAYRVRYRPGSSVNCCYVARSGRRFRCLVRIDTPDHRPGLELRDRRRLLDPHRFAGLIGIRLIMSVVLLRAAND